VRETLGSPPDLATPEGARTVMRRFAVRPVKRFGQHFLVSRRALDQIVAAAALSAADTVLEVGAGLGTLSQALASAAGRVTAVEIDRRLLPVLTETLGAYPTVRIVGGDMLALPAEDLFGGPRGAPRKVVANLPYNIATPVLIRLLDPTLRVVRIIVTVQREVADRITARPGTSAYGRLSIAVQFRGGASVVGRIPRGAFLPPPDVDSAIVCILPSPKPAVAVPDEAEFFRIVAAGFGQRRKMLQGALSHGLGLPADSVASACAASGVDASARAERVDLTGFAALAHALHPLLRERFPEPPRGRGV